MYGRVPYGTRPYSDIAVQSAAGVTTTLVAAFGSFVLTGEAATFLALSGGGGAGVVMTGASFTRKRFRELMAAIEAADRKRQTIAKPKPREAIAAAIEVARIAAVDEPDDRLAKLTELLSSAANAASLARVITQSHRVVEFARNAGISMAQARFDEDEEEAALLILLN